MNSHHPSQYASTLSSVLADFDWSPVERLAGVLDTAWAEGRHLFLCGNGGSAANAIHIANDFIYGIGKEIGGGMKVTALPANAAVVTCLGNDLGYETIFARQLAVLASRGDILIVLSGSGNSPNILRALEEANAIGMETYAILGYSGGKAKELAGGAIHFAVDDMQIAEDLQMVVGHMLMKMLCGGGRRVHPPRGHERDEDSLFRKRRRRHRPIEGGGEPDRAMPRDVRSDPSGAHGPPRGGEGARAISWWSPSPRRNS